MREYFWLFMIVALENLIALGIELINGGVWTQQVGFSFTLTSFYALSHLCMLFSLLFVFTPPVLTDGHNAGSLLQLGHQTGLPDPLAGVPDHLLQEIPHDPGPRPAAGVRGLAALPPRLLLLLA